MEDGKYLIGRQPILNRDEEIVGFELLFRSPGAATATVQDASQATARVILNTLTGFGVEDILGRHKGFINFDLELLMDDSLGILPKELMVLELLETLQVTPELIDRCRFLRESGFTLALDDHEYSPAFEELYEIAEIVKIDLIQSPLARLKEMVPQFRRHPLQLLAEKVETQDEFRACLDLGFDLFQGYYFAKPSVIEKKRLDDSGSTLLKLMRLLNEDASLETIEGTFRENAGLTYQLLLLVNSVSVGARSRIETVRHAIAMIGRQQIKRWVQLALFAGNDNRGAENPLVDMAAVRAAMMENLARFHRTLKKSADATEKAFMTGILSILERVYDIPVEEVVDKLHLSDDIKEALVSRAGALGKLLQVAELLEGMEFQEVRPHLDEMGISLENVLACQMKAYTWRRGMGES